MNNILRSVRTSERPIDSGMVPQVDSLTRILQALAVISSGVGLSSETIDLSHRHVNYVLHAGRLLALLSETNALTGVGLEIVKLGSQDQLRALGGQFAESACGREWLKWSRSTSLSEI